MHAQSKTPQTLQKGDQQPLVDTIQDQVRAEVDALLAERHHDLGDVADSVWENKSIRKAMKSPSLRYTHNNLWVFVKSGRQHFRMFKSGWHLHKW